MSQDERVGRLCKALNSPPYFKFWIAWSLGFLYFGLFQVAVYQNYSPWQLSAIPLHAGLVLFWSHMWSLQ
jgi:hypothetical protein